MSDVIKVLFVDDDPRLRSSWERLIAAQEDMRCAGTLDRADDLEAQARSLGADVALVDLTMPGRDPLDVIGEMTEHQVRTKVVVYSGQSDPDLVQRTFDAGAWGFADKLDSPSEILGVIRRVAAGDIAFPPSFTP